MAERKWKTKMSQVSRYFGALVLVFTQVLFIPETASGTLATVAGTGGTAASGTTAAASYRTGTVADSFIAQRQQGRERLREIREDIERVRENAEEFERNGYLTGTCNQCATRCTQQSDRSDIAKLGLGDDNNEYDWEGEEQSCEVVLSAARGRGTRAVRRSSGRRFRSSTRTRGRRSRTRRTNDVIQAASWIQQNLSTACSAAVNQCGRVAYEQELEGFADDIERLEEELRTARSEIAASERESSQQMAILAQTCPTCFQQIREPSGLDYGLAVFQGLMGVTAAVVPPALGLAAHNRTMDQLAASRTACYDNYANSYVPTLEGQGFIPQQSRCDSLYGAGAIGAIGGFGGGFGNAIGFPGAYGGFGAAGGIYLNGGFGGGLGGLGWGGNPYAFAPGGFAQPGAGAFFQAGAALPGGVGVVGSPFVQGWGQPVVPYAGFSAGINGGAWAQPNPFGFQAGLNGGFIPGRGFVGGPGGFVGGGFGPGWGGGGFVGGPGGFVGGGFGPGGWGGAGAWGAQANQARIAQQRAAAAQSSLAYASMQSAQANQSAWMAQAGGGWGQPFGGQFFGPTAGFQFNAGFGPYAGFGQNPYAFGNLGRNPRGF